MQLWTAVMTCIIKGGISSDDKLAFPYGKDVVEGAKTNEVTLDYMYNQ